MAYIIIGVVSVIVLLGGGKKFLVNFGGKNILIVILLTLVMIGQIIPPIRITNYFYFSIGGTLLLIYAFISAFYRNKFTTQLYIFYISALLGFAFYFFGRYVSGITGISLFEKMDKLFYTIIALTVCLFAGNAKNAFSISILSITVADLLYAIQTKTVYNLGGGRSFTAVVLITAIAMVAQILIKMVTVRLCPSRKEMLFEASEEIYPEEKDE